MGVSFQFLSELNNIFHVKDLKIVTFYIKLIDEGERPNKKNIESLDLTLKVILLSLWSGKYFVYFMIILPGNCFKCWRWISLTVFDLIISTVIKSSEHFTLYWTPKKIVIYVIIIIVIVIHSTLSSPKNQSNCKLQVYHMSTKTKFNLIYCNHKFHSHSILKSTFPTTSTFPS